MNLSEVKTKTITELVEIAEKLWLRRCRQTQKARYHFSNFKKASR